MLCPDLVLLRSDFTNDTCIPVSQYSAPEGNFYCVWERQEWDKVLGMGTQDLPRVLLTSGLGRGLSEGLGMVQE